MRKLITIDIGNTSIDICEHEGKNIRFIGKFEKVDDALNILEGKERIIASSVRPSLREEFIKRLGNGIKFINPDNINIRVEYKSKESIGIDRVLFAYGVKKFYSDTALLVSAGTALVVDLLIEGVFKGGFITCGLRTKAKALHESAELLPLVEPEMFKGTIGVDTLSAIKGGIFLESLYFIKGVKERFENLYGKHLCVFITGGDGYLFKDMGLYDPFIIHRAMAEAVKEV